MKVTEIILFFICICASVFGIGKYWGEADMTLVFFSGAIGLMAFFAIAIDGIERRSKDIIVGGYRIYVISYAIITAYVLYLTTGQLPPKPLLWLTSLIGFWAIPLGTSTFKKLSCRKKINLSRHF